MLEVDEVEYMLIEHLLEQDEVVYDEMVLYIDEQPQIELQILEVEVDEID
jgi:hypothetical protein